MPLRALFDADTETFETGPYERAVRVRKWIYLFSFFVTVLAHGWFGGSDVVRWLGLTGVPNDAIWKVASFGLLYFAVQYFLVLLQTFVLYPGLLRRRFGERSRARQRELETAIDELNNKSRVRSEELDSEREKLRARINHAHQQRDTNEVAIGERALARLEMNDDDEAGARARQHDQLMVELKEAIAADFERRPTVRLSEIALDLWRLAPPMLVGSGTLVIFGRLF